MTAERGQQGDHGQQGDPGRQGFTGREGLQGIQGEQGPEGVVPGGVFRLTDIRILIMFFMLIAAFVFLFARSESNATSIRTNNYNTCRDFAVVIQTANEDKITLTDLPDCERLKP